MSRVAKRYAKALFELVIEQKCLEAVEADFKLLDDLLAGNKDFDIFLSNPLISESARFRGLKEIFEGRLSNLTMQFLLLLSEKKRLALLPDVAQNFRRLILDYRNTIEGELISAVQLLPAQVAQIQQNVEGMIGKSVLFTEHISPEIIGGFVVRFQDVVIDNSIRCQLAKLREKLIAG